MSGGVTERVRTTLGTAAAASDSERTLRTRTRELVFGDRVGLAVFLSTLCVVGLVWRTGFFITDSYTLANGLAALEQGSVSMSEPAYGSNLRTPGAHVRDGAVYARNYGVLVAALPVSYALAGIQAVADLRIVAVGGWCLLVLAAVLVTGRAVGRERVALVGGTVGVLALFALNVALATPLTAGRHLIALQVVHAVAAGFVAVFTYRLGRVIHDRRTGLLAVGLSVVGTPLVFWATVPKRHVVAAAVALGVALALVSSREEGTGSTAARATAYGMMGLFAWVHAPEALLLFVALVLVDLPTAPRNDPRTLALVGGAFALSLVPMLVTNALVSGDPLVPPRMLDAVSTSADVAFGGGGGGAQTGGAGGGGQSGGGTGQGGPLLPAPVRAVLATLAGVLVPITTLLELLWRGLVTFATRPTDVYHTFVRSGFVQGVADRAAVAASTNLSVLESAPALAALTALAPATLRADRDSLATPARAADAFVVLAVVGYALLYVSRLPLHAQVTVRYLFPLYPLGVYGLVRIPSVRGCLRTHWQTAVWSFAGGFLVGGQLLVVALVALDASKAEAFQVHAILALVIAAPLAVWGVAGGRDRLMDRLGAVLLGLGAAATAVFIALLALEYFPLEWTHLLPMVRAVAEVVSFL